MKILNSLRGFFAGKSSELETKDSAGSRIINMNNVNSSAGFGSSLEY